LQQGVAATDRHCRRLIAGLRDRYSQVNVILFGDHGMVNVTRALDLTPVLEATGLTFGTDYAYFLDSTMARFWFFHAAAKSRLERALREVEGGRLLEAEDLERFGLARCDYRNGERFFLADPGVLILPNFFQPSGSPIPGMHGYDPDCPDNLGFFLLHDPSRPELAGTHLGKVDPHGLFPIVLRSVGLDPARYAKTELPRPVRRAAAPGRYTLQQDPAAESVVSDQLELVVQAITRRAGAVEAVVLTGSFGRGEGGVYRDAGGRFRPVNDYDLTVVGPPDLGARLQGLGEELARELGIDFVDLSASDGRWEQWPLTIANYDLKYGSQVIAGNPAVLDRLPAYASADLPPEEIVRLLLNRTAGLLIGLRGKFLGGEAPTEDERRFLANQVVKALMALGDWHLFQWRGYDSSYARRRERFSALASGAGVGPVIAAKICQAYDFKCRPDYTQFADGVGEIRLLYAELEAAWIQSIQRLAGKPLKTLPEALAQYRARMGPASPRHATYAALPLVLHAAVAGAFGEPFQQARPQLPFRCDLPAMAKFTPEHWELVRAAAVQSWFTECH
jgi:predicted nucleotidyltransferase